MSDVLDKMAQKQAAYEARIDACPHKFGYPGEACLLCGVSQSAWFRRRALLAETRVSTLVAAECEITAALAKLAHVVGVEAISGEEIAKFAGRVCERAVERIALVEAQRVAESSQGKFWVRLYDEARTELITVHAERDEWKSLAADLRVQESRISGTLCDAGSVNTGDLAAGVAELLVERDAAVKRAEEAEALVEAATRFRFGDFAAVKYVDDRPDWYVRDVPRDFGGPLVTRDAAIQKARELAGEKGGEDE